jgi:hypothetical protein
MHRAEIDQQNNRLVLRWIDSLNVSEIDRFQTEIAALLPQLRPDFDCISDISNMRPSSRHVSERIEKLQEFLHHAGMRRVVRIVGKGSGAHIASEQMDRTAAEAGYTTVHVDNEAEALSVLSRDQAHTP